MSSCSICCEAFNKVSRSKVTCSACAADVCRTCVSTFLGTSLKDPHCMNCQAPWTRHFIQNNLSASFLGTSYRKHRGDILYEREQGLLAESLPLAAVAKKLKDVGDQLQHARVAKKELVRLPWDLNVQMQRLERDFDILNWDKILKEANEIQEKHIKIVQLDAEIVKLTHLKRRLKVELDMMMAGPNQESSSKPRTTSEKYIRPCTVDGCRGLMNTQFKCVMCDTQFCKDCHEPVAAANDKTKKHVCTEADIASARFIIKEAKCCPQCHALTYKISGCSQIWCTLCHATWDWNTQALDKGGIIHNPHYFEYIEKRRKGDPAFRPNPVPCQLVPEHADLYYHAGTLGMRMQDMAWVFHLQRLRNHMIVVERAACAHNAMLDNKDLRVRYLINDIDREMFKRLLLQREKKIESNKEAGEIIETFIAVSTDLLQKFMLAKRKADTIEIMQEFQALCGFFNEAFLQHAKSFKSTKRTIIAADTFVVQNIKV